MDEILTAKELAKISTENAAEVHVQDVVAAHDALEKFYNEYLKVEADYGHFKVTVRNYNQVLVLTTAGICKEFFKALSDLGYKYETENVRTTDTGAQFDSILTVSWDRPRHENCH